ncbi:MAG TPA: sulfite exporter TauE/SafE family protein [Actinomycetota bacterium]|nr:sulfite exporter TauE/SafE family protein [Actinomycetota bacterium]
MSRRLLVCSALLWTLLPIGAAGAHPAGLPPLAEISHAQTSVRTSLSVAMDDTILLFTTAGAPERDPTGPDPDALATQPEAAAYITSRYVLAVPEGKCTAQVVGGRPIRGTGFRFLIDHECPAPVRDTLTVRSSLLRDLSPAYRLAISVKVGGDRVRYTIEEGEDALTMDLTKRPTPGKTVQEGPDRTEQGRLFLFNYLDSGRGAWAAVVALGTAFLLGVAALAAGQSISGHRVENWLHAISAALVLGVGLFMLKRRIGLLRAGADEHHHHHHAPPVATGADHLPAEQRALSGKGLVAVAAAGGILPCPEAFGLLFASLTVGRVAAGLLILVAFSVGLGAVLFAVTLSLIMSKRAVAPSLERSRVVRYLPVLSAVIVTAFGVVLAVSAARSF